MQRKWRYKVERIKLPSFAKLEEKTQSLQDRLDRLGMEGWELITIETSVSGGYPLFYFKRLF